MNIQDQNFLDVTHSLPATDSFLLPFSPVGPSKGESRALSIGEEGGGIVETDSRRDGGSRETGLYDRDGRG
jgi:hypothetical protein